MTDYERGFLAGLHAAVKEVQGRLNGRVRSGWVRFDRDAAELSDAIRALRTAEPAPSETREKYAPGLTPEQMAEARRIGRAIADADPLLQEAKAMVAKVSPSPATQAACETCCGSGENTLFEPPRKCGDCDGSGRAT